MPKIIESFVVERGANQLYLQNMTSNNLGCFTTANYAICYNKKQLTKNVNERLQESYYKILSLKTRVNLYNYIIPNESFVKFQDKSNARKIYLYNIEHDNTKYQLAGMEFITAKDADNIYSVAAIQTNNLEANINLKTKSNFFKFDYCQGLFPLGKSLFLQGKFQEALVILKELHDLKWANVEAYILAADAFLKIGSLEDALKIAQETLHLLQKDLNAELAEHLGDIFLALGDNQDAKICFELASTLMN